MTLIAAHDVTRRFGPVLAVDGVSMQVGAGEVVGLVGANGAGKTTLIRLLLGLVAPDRGSVTLADGRPCRATRERVGYVPQGLGLWTDLTLREHLELVADVYGTSTDAIGDAGLEEQADVCIGDLPLGLRRRAAFVVALSHQPDAVILDEPTSGVDPLARQRLWEAIRLTADGGAGVLVSTHYLEEATRCDRVLLMRAGQVVAEGTVADLTAGRSSIEVTAAMWQEAWQRLEAAGMDVLPAGRGLRVIGTDERDVVGALGGLDARSAEVPATLEEVFLQVARS